MPAVEPAEISSRPVASGRVSNPGTGSSASVVWVNQPRRARALVFIAIDGKSRRDRAFSSLERDPYMERDPYIDDGGKS